DLACGPQAAGEREPSRRPSASTDASGRSGNLVPGVERLGGGRLFGGHVRLRRSRPLPPQREIASTGRVPYPEKALSAVPALRGIATAPLRFNASRARA